MLYDFGEIDVHVRYAAKRQYAANKHAGMGNMNRKIISKPRIPSSAILKAGATPKIIYRAMAAINNAINLLVNRLGFAAVFELSIFPFIVLISLRLISSILNSLG